MTQLDARLASLADELLSARGADHWSIVGVLGREWQSGKGQNRRNKKVSFSILVVKD